MKTVGIMPNKMPISMPIEARISLYAIPGIQEEAKIKKLTLETAYNVVSRHYDIGIAQILSKSRLRELMVPRHLIMYFMYKHSCLTLYKIGRKMKRDHATILHAKRSIENYRHTDKKFASVFEEIKKEIEEELRK